MATVYFRHPANTEQKVIWSGTIASTTNTHTFIVTITDDNGDTASITVTADGVLTVTQLAAAFVSAWNLSLNPLLSELTASSSAGVITLTQDTAGRPVVIATSGTGTWSADDYTQDSISNTDYSQASNFSSDAVPTTDDDVIFGKGSVNCLYGLNQSSVAIDDFSVEQGCKSSFGRWDDGKLHYLRLKPNSFTYRGEGRLNAFDFGSEAIALLVEGTGSPESGLKSIYLKGSALTTVEVRSGSVGIATLTGETSQITTLLCGLLDGIANVDAELGVGLTLATLRQTGGKCRAWCDIATVVVSNGAFLTIDGAAAVTTSLTVQKGGTCYANGSGTIAAAHVYGTLDFSRDRTAKTVTTLNAYPGGKVILHAGVTVSTWAISTALASQEPFQIIVAQ